MGPSFNWPNQAELWVPIALPPARYHDPDFRHNENLFAVARVRPGVTVQQANAYLDRKVQENIASEGSNSGAVAIATTKPSATPATVSTMLSTSA